MSTPYFPTVDRPPPAWSVIWAQRLVDALNTLIGKANSAADLTLTANATTTTMTDARLSPFSVLTFMPTTATAATALGGLYVAAATMNNGSCVVTHANTADTDKTFRVAIHG